MYRDLYGHSRKMTNISLRLKENKNVQLNHNRLLYYGANYVKINSKVNDFHLYFFPFSSKGSRRNFCKEAWDNLTKSGKPFVYKPRLLAK